MPRAASPFLAAPAKRLCRTAAAQLRHDGQIHHIGLRRHELRADIARKCAVQPRDEPEAEAGFQLLRNGVFAQGAEKLQTLQRGDVRHIGGGHFLNFDHLAAYQLSPCLASATSGTRSAAACSISFVTICMTCCASSCGHSTISSSCTWQQPGLEPLERMEHTYHGQLDDVRRAALHGRVERDALRTGADVEIRAFDLRNGAAAAEDRLHIALFRAPSP